MSEHDTEAAARAIGAHMDGTPVADADFEALKRLQAAVVDSGVAAFLDRAEHTVDVFTEQVGRHTVHPDGQVWVDPPRAEQAQPGGYTPPVVGAPTWPRAYGATIVELDDRLEIEWPSGRGMSWVVPKVIEGWVEQVNELRAERVRLRVALAEVERGLTDILEFAPVDDLLRLAREVLADPEPLIDPDCRDGKHSSCVGAPCECECHGGKP